MNNRMGRCLEQTEGISESELSYKTIVNCDSLYKKTSEH